MFGIYAAGGMNADGSVNTTSTNAALVSFSYINDYGGLTPDNYAFMPKIKVLPGAKMTFHASGFDPSYSNEHFGVAVASSDGLNIATIAEWDSRYPYSPFTVDLSAYAGHEIFLGFRHFTTVANYALCIDNITVTNAIWSGTTSETAWYNIYRSTDGSNYDLIGIADGSQTSYEDNDISAVTFYYQVTAINTIAGGSCESEPAMATDGIHDFVVVTTDGIDENVGGVRIYPNPTDGVLFVQTLRATSLQDQTYRITNMMGQTLMTGQIVGEVQQIDVANLPKGMYFITLGGMTQKLVVR